jgi:hypothetical protein
MDIFDFFPMVPPGGPGDLRDRSPGHQLAAGVGPLLLPAVANGCALLLAALGAFFETF